jgi:hypothetical protein
MEVFPMQPGPNSDEINTILSRFHTWAEKQPADGNGNGHRNGAGELREMSYQEAILQHRGRRPAQMPRPAASPEKNAAPTEQKSAVERVMPAPVRTAQPASELVPERIATPPVVSHPEPVEVRQVAPAPPAELENAPALTLALEESSIVSESARKPAKRNASASTVGTKAPKQALVVTAAPEIPAAIAMATITASPAPRPACTASRKRQPAKINTAAPGTAAVEPIIAAAIPAGPIASIAKPAAKSAIRTSPTKITAKSPAAQSKAIRKIAAPTVAATKLHKIQRPAFRQVLAKSMQPAKASASPKNKPAPDRTRRITTRFSPAEECRIEKQAADLGINVSAYLRQCALAASAAQNALAPPIVNAAGNKKARKPHPEAPAESRLYYPPRGSFLGGWLALLRNRFLGPSARFSEEA